jgi:hypothetical protein
VRGRGSMTHSVSLAPMHGSPEGTQGRPSTVS